MCSSKVRVLQIVLVLTFISAMLFGAFLSLAHISYITRGRGVERSAKTYNGSELIERLVRIDHAMFKRPLTSVGFYGVMVFSMVAVIKKNSTLALLSAVLLAFMPLLILCDRVTYDLDLLVVIMVEFAVIIATIVYAWLVRPLQTNVQFESVPSSNKCSEL